MKDRQTGFPRALLALFLFCALLLTACGEGFSGALYPVGTLPAEDSSGTAEPAMNPDAEVRGIWIATAANINYPSAPGLSREQLAAELDDIVATAKEAGLNAIFFQVRPAGDALCQSDLFPVSEVLSGEQGKAADGDFDPLAYLIAAAHAKKIAVHAWVNPFRVTTGSAAYPRTDLSALAENNPARKHPEYVIAYADGRLYYDPGNPAVRELVAAGVRELAEKYELEGIVFDDYFYPYPVTGENGALAAFDDGASYRLFGGGKPLADWRRENINETVRLCSEAVHAANESCLFGIAPFGIWQNDDGQNGGSPTAGLESYSSIYCDPLAWVKAETVDYLAPQIYWDFSTSVAPYGELVRWWNAALAGSSVKLLISHGLYRYAEEGGAEAGEIGAQVTFARAEERYRGSVHFGYAVLKQNTKGAADELRALYLDPLAYPETESAGGEAVLCWPAEGTVTNADRITLVGTADPAARVTAGGRAVGLSKDGVFAVSFSLETGENRLSVSVDGKVYTRTVRRTDGEEISSLGSYRIDGASPAVRTTLRAGEKLAVRCLAPRGSTVTASLGGETVRLAPKETGSSPADRDAAAVYLGEIALPGPGANEIRSLGTLTFTAVRGGEEARAEGGEVRVIPAGSFLSLKTEREGLLLRENAYLASGAISAVGLPVGADCYASEERDGSYRLSFGDWVSAEGVSEQGVVSELPPVTVHKMLQSQSRTGETLVTVRVINSFPVFRSTLVGDTLTITFPGAVLSADTITRSSPSELVGEVAFETSAEGVSVKIAFSDPSRYNGATVYFDKAGEYDVMSVRFREPAEGGLAGKTVLLSPLPFSDGFTLGEGKSEEDLLAAFAASLSAQLEKRGASVLLSGAEDASSGDPDLILFLALSRGAEGLSVTPENAVGDAAAERFFAGSEISAGTGGRRPDAALRADPTVPAFTLTLGDAASPEDLHRLLSERERQKIAQSAAAGLSAVFGGEG
ncbi:MAG: family 10 glycosylhydrolase [Clostridia bacterium]|nr:family 10 glycosylhydrolase [Clostridia bacterium]